MFIEASKKTCAKPFEFTLVGWEGERGRVAGCFPMEFKVIGANQEYQVLTAILSDLIYQVQTCKFRILLSGEKSFSVSPQSV